MGSELQSLYNFNVSGYEITDLLVKNLILAHYIVRASSAKFTHFAQAKLSTLS